MNLAIPSVHLTAPFSNIHEATKKIDVRNPNRANSFSETQIPASSRVGASNRICLVLVVTGWSFVDRHPEPEH